MLYYIANHGTQTGPFQLDQLIDHGLEPESLIWREGMAQWTRAALVAECASLLQNASRSAGPAGPGAFASAVPPPFQPPLGYMTAPAPVSGSLRIPAGICGIFLGALGIHKFILGYTGAGLTMLLVSLLTCGIGAPIMHLIGLVEGIVYITKSDEQFYREYVAGRREWF